MSTKNGKDEPFLDERRLDEEIPSQSANQGSFRNPSLFKLFFSF